MFAELLPDRQEKREEFLPELTVRIGGAVISVNRDTPEILLQRAIRAAKNAE